MDIQPPVAPVAQGVVNPPASQTLPVVEIAQTAEANAVTIPTVTLPDVYSTATPAAATEEKDETFIPEKETIKSRIEKSNFFRELDEKVVNFSGADAERAAAQKALATLNGDTSVLGFAGGQIGRILAATFINREQRNDADFRYAYGEDAFRKFMNARQVLNDIPKGSLADALSVDLIKQVAIEVYSADEEPVLERMGHAVRGFQDRKIVPGAIRDYVTNTSPMKAFTEAEIAATQSFGLRYEPIGFEKAIVHYPEPAEIQTRLYALIANTRAQLNDPASDIVKVAATFSQEFIAIHPLQNMNGRVGRLLLERILGERDVPAPILKDSSNDFSLSKDQYEEEVRKGITRTVSAVQKIGVGTNDRSIADYATRILKEVAPNLVLPETAPRLLIDGLLYAEGPAGFIYDQAGRPHLIGNDNKLVPLSQMTAYFLIRRISQAVNPEAAVEALTQKTKSTFAAWLKSGGTHASVARDNIAIKADNDYIALLGNDSSDAAIVNAFSPALWASPEVLFTKGVAKKDSKLTFAMSRYQQIDHEYRFMQKAAKKAKNDEAEEAFTSARKQLFEYAKTYLETLKDPTRVSSENPLGCKYAYENIQYGVSPLRYKSFEDAERKSNGNITLFRGDHASVMFTGVFPDGRIKNSDAKEVGDFRASRGGTVSLLQDLSSVLGSSGGTGYQSFTTDLGLLSSNGGFAEQSNAITVNLGALPEWVQPILRNKLDVGEELSINSLTDLRNFAITGRATPAGHVDITTLAPEKFDEILKRVYVDDEKKKLLQKRYSETEKKHSERNFFGRFLDNMFDKKLYMKVDDLLDENKLLALRKEISKEEDYVTIRRDAKDPQKAIVTAQRRAFIFSVEPEIGIVAPGTLGVGRFIREQEISVFDLGVRQTGPTHIEAFYSQFELQKELPVTN